MNKFFKISICSFFLLGLTSCEESLKIDQIKILNLSENIKGEIQIGQSSYPIEKGHVSLPLQSVSSLNLQLDLKFKNNIPNLTNYPSAKINQEIKLKYDKSSGGYVEFKEANLESPTQNIKKFNCQKGIKTTFEQTTITLDFSDFKSITSACSGEGLKKIDPESIGFRNINDYSFLKHNFFSIEDDQKLGEEFVVKYLKENRNLILPQEHGATLYVKNVMENIVANSDRPDLRPKVYIINAKILNAFALPGGYVFVFRGLMEKAPSESALISVLAHEWAHVTARHGTENMTRAIDRMLLVLTAKLAIDISLEKKDAAAKELISTLAYGAMLAGSELFMMNKSREAELEADTLGTQYAYKSGFNPWGISEMFQVFKDESGRDFTTIEKLMSSHPDHDTRIGNGYLLSSQFYPNQELKLPHKDLLNQAIADMSNLSYPSQSESEKIGLSFANGLNQFTKSKLEDLAYKIYSSKK